METPSENTEPSAEKAEPPAPVCKNCGRALSQKTGICYYCNQEVDKETEKNLSLLLLDWQKEAAADPEARETENLRKILSIIMAISAAACVAMGIVPNIDPFFPVYSHWILAIAIAGSCWSFYFNTITALMTVLTNMAGIIFYGLLILEAVPERLVATAFLSGLIVGLCGFTLFLIFIRIFKTKTVEL